MGWVGSEFFLADTQSRLYPHMRAKFGRDPTAVLKKVSFKFIIGLRYTMQYVIVILKYMPAIVLLLMCL